MKDTAELCSLTLTNLAKVMSIVKEITAHISKMDPSFECIESINALISIMEPYKEIYEEQQAATKQSIVMTLLRSFTTSPLLPSAPDSEAGPSGVKTGPSGITHTTTNWWMDP